MEGDDVELLEGKEYIEILYDLLDNAITAEDWEMYDSLFLELNKVTRE
jgi:hypothetical protein